MTILKPKVDTVRDLSNRLGLKVAEADFDTYAKLMEAMVGSYERLEAMGSPSPEKPGRGLIGRAPTKAENPHGAWAWLGPIKPTGKGILDGIEVGVKDAICVAGMPARNGSRLLANFVPDFDATVVSRVLSAGGTIKGKTACENLSFSGHSHTSSPPVQNPRAPGYSAGGSSSGSAAAIAAGDVNMALGCDQGGSVRIPASWSGIVGLKPTHGLVPYTGAFSMDAAIDHCGPMGATVEDVARLLTVIVGSDNLDPRQRAVPNKRKSYLDALTEENRPRKIGIVKQGFGRPESEAETDEVVRDALGRYRAMGIEVTEIDLPCHLECFDVWSAIVIGGTSELMFKQNGMAGFGEGYADPDMMQVISTWRNRPEDISVTALPPLLMGSYIAEKYHNRFYAKAQSLLRTMRMAYDRAFSTFDVLAMPTTPFSATAMPAEDSSLRNIIELSLPMVGNTAPFNASGHPAISLPCGEVDGRPVGLMMVGRHFGEADLLSAAAFCESK